MDKYIGFYIDKPIGNNIFSYEDRENKKIFIKFTKYSLFLLRIGYLGAIL